MVVKLGIMKNESNHEESVIIVGSDLEYRAIPLCMHFYATLCSKVGFLCFNRYAHL